MLGFGETHDEIERTLDDLRAHDVDVVTFGQYLRPTRRHIPVKEYVTPEAFEEWQTIAEGKGFRYVASGPLVRSSSSRRRSSKTDARPTHVPTPPDGHRTSSARGPRTADHRGIAQLTTRQLARPRPLSAASGGARRAPERAFAVRAPI